MVWNLRDKVAIVGLGQTAFAREGRSGRSAFDSALEAIKNAAQDAGILVKDIDGFATYMVDSSDPYSLAQVLGVKETHFMDRYAGGGESLAGIIHHSAMAIAAGAAETIVCYRSLGGQMIARSSEADADPKPEAVSSQGAFRSDFLSPFGAFIPVQHYAIQFQRHMTDFGTTTEQLGALCVSQNKNAQRNPNAITYGRPITLEDHANARMISYPYRLYDCTQFLDGAGAVIVTSAERAKSLKQPPVYVLGAAEGSGGHDQTFNQMRHQARFNTAGMQEVARDLFSRAGIGPQEVDVAQVFQTFSGQTLLTLEDFGFCKLGESGPFVESGGIDFEGGSIPINTHGGDLSEGYLHGFGNLLEGVRQMRGTSTAQVEGASTCLVTAGPSAMPGSAVIRRR